MQTHTIPIHIPFVLMLALTACVEDHPAPIPEGTTSGSSSSSSSSSSAGLEPTTWQPCWENGDNGLPPCPGWCDRYPQDCEIGDGSGNVDGPPIVFDVGTMPGTSSGTSSGSGTDGLDEGSTSVVP